MKVFITGGSGILGQYLNIELSRKFDILTQYNSNPGNCGKYNSVQLDLLNLEDLGKTVEKFSPDIIIHAAALANTVTIEPFTPKYVYDLNVGVTEYLAVLCKAKGIKLVYTSTDQVYAGDRGSMLKENAKLMPLSIYGETKLVGEYKVINTFNNYIIIRLGLLFGFGLNHSRMHFDNMYENFRNSKKVRLFTDQYRTPLSVIEAARIISSLCEKDIKGEIINAGGKERVSRFEFGGLLCDLAGFDKSLIEPSTMDSVPGLAPVADVSMDSSKLDNLGISRLNLQEAFKEILKH